MRIPIACSLEAHDAANQLDEWRLLLGRQTLEARRVSPTEVVVRLTDGIDELPALVRLAQREKACCPFFEFGLEIGAEAVALTVSVPDDAASLLDQFFPTLLDQYSPTTATSGPHAAAGAEPGGVTS